MPHEGARPTAFGVVVRLKELLGLDPGASEQEVLDAAEAALGGKKKKGKKDDEE